MSGEIGVESKRKCVGSLQGFLCYSEGRMEGEVECGIDNLGLYDMSMTYSQSKEDDFFSFEISFGGCL